MPDQSAADKARELDRIGHEAAQSHANPGNRLRWEAENWGILVEQPRDAERLEDARDDEDFKDRLKGYGDAPAPNTHVSTGAEGAAGGRPAQTKDVLDALKRPTSLMLLGATGLGLALVVWVSMSGRTADVVGSEPLATATLAAPTPIATPVPAVVVTLVPTPAPTPTPAIARINGFTVTYSGPFEVRGGGTLNVELQVLDAQGRPAQGTVFATLGDPPSDSRATHGNAVLDTQGRATIALRVNWPAGRTVLYTSWQDTVRPLAAITVQ